MPALKTNGATARYRQAFEQNPVAMLVFDANTFELLDVNTAALAALGVSPEALSGLTAKHIFGDDFRAATELRAAKAFTARPIDGLPSELHVTTRLLNGTEPALGIAMAGMPPDAAEKSPAELAAESAVESRLREVNEQLVMTGLREQAAREEAERANMVKDEFLAVMSHELRTPLQAMMGWIVLLRSGALDPAESERALEVIERNTMVQAQLVADLLDVARATSGKLHLELRPLDLRPLVTAVIESVRVEAESKDITIEADIDSRPVLVDGDATRLEQVAANLLVNAVKFTPRGGTATVTVSADRANAQLRVTDTGVGFDADFASKMFQPFRQENGQSSRRHGGLGLGLMIVRHMVEAHGGTVRAESAGRGSGATFVVDLPVSQEMADADGGGRYPAGKTSTSAGEGCVLSGLRTLLVEDHSDSRRFLSLVLRRSGAEVRDASSAEEALALLAVAPVDVVVSDIEMPEVDGYAFLGALRKIQSASDVPVVALSAYASATDRERALAAGFWEHAGKPIQPKQLIDIVARATGRPSV